jgi:Transposase
VQEFGSWTADLKRLAVWLKSCGIRTVVVQSTGVYWIALQEVLEEAGFEVYLVNARGTKNLPGRKSDVQECQWLMKLHTYGLLRNSFRPPEEIRKVRTIWRRRDSLVADAGSTIQQMQKALTTMNNQLSNAISDISGVTGLAMIRAIVKGERDPWRLAKLRDRRIQASEEEVAHSLENGEARRSQKENMEMAKILCVAEHRAPDRSKAPSLQIDLLCVSPVTSRKLLILREQVFASALCRCCGSSGAGPRPGPRPATASQAARRLTMRTPRCLAPGRRNRVVLL